MTHSPDGGPLSSESVCHAPSPKSDWLPRLHAAPDFDDAPNPEPTESTRCEDPGAQARLDVVRARLDVMMDTPVVSR